MLVEEYDETKAEYEALSDEHKSKFDDILGELAVPFKESKMMIELELNTVDDPEERFAKLN